jgi:hypothetical protein
MKQEAKRRISQSAGQRDAHAQELRPWHEVTAIFNRRHGTRLTKGVVWFICRNAERKLRAILEGER